MKKTSHTYQNDQGNTAPAAQHLSENPYVKAKKLISGIMAFMLVFTLMPIMGGNAAYAEGIEEASGNEVVEVLSGIGEGAGSPARSPLDEHPYGSEAYWEEINGSPLSYKNLSDNKRTLSTGTYYIKGTHTLNGDPLDSNEAGSHVSGLRIQGDVTLRFVDNAAIIAKGTNGSGKEAGGTGIFIPYGSKLTVEGVGMITASGGSGGAPADGGNGGDAEAYRLPIISGALEYPYGKGGAGGSGGDGAGAPGTGIGGMATSGAVGGSGGPETEIEEWVRPNMGGKGTGSAAGITMGSFVAKGNISIVAKGGARGSEQGGSGGSPGASLEESSVMNKRYWIGVTGGAGGGGGGTSGISADIGSGASGGAGGGGGSSGAPMNGYDRHSYFLGASGGGGGGIDGKGGLPSLTVASSGSPYRFDGKEGEASTSYSGGAGGYNQPTSKSGNGWVLSSKGGDGGSQMTSVYDLRVYGTTLTGEEGDTGRSADAKSATRYAVYPIDECKVEFLDDFTYDADGTPVFAYTGSAITPRIRIIHVPTGTILNAGIHYSVSYSSNVVGGEGSISIAGSSFNTTGGSLVNSSVSGPARQTVPFRIKYDMSKYSISWKGQKLSNPITYVYTGSRVGEAYLITPEGAEIPRADYTVVYANDVEPGESTAQVTFSATELQAGKWRDPDAKLTASYSIRKAPVITTARGPHPDALPGVLYSMNLQADGHMPITWTLIAGSLPDGCYLSADGLVSGVPTRTGAWSAVIRATNSVGYDQDTFRWETGDVMGITWHDRNRNGVKDPGEEPLAGVKATAYRTDTMQEVASAYTDSEGNYAIQGLYERNIEEVDITFTAPDPDLYRPIDGDTVKGIEIDGLVNRADKGYGKSVEITLHSGEHGAFPGSDTKVFRAYPGDTMVVGVPADLTIDEDWRLEAWYTDPGFQFKFNNICPATDAHLYANYDQRNYRVEYLPGEGVDPISPRPVDFNEAGLLPDPEPQRSGYVLVKWVIDSDESVAVTNADSYSDLVKADLDIMTVVLRAVWEYRSDLKVVLDANGSLGAPATINGQATETHENLKYDEVMNYSPPIREGFSFLGWSESKDYDPATDSVPTMSLKVPGENTTYYAAWEAKDVGIIFDTVGGDFVEGEDGMRNGLPGEGFVLPDNPTYAGYTFKGWYETPTGNSRMYEPGDQHGFIPMVKTYYYAQWEPDTIALTLEAEGGTPDAQKLTGPYMTTVQYDIPARPGYVFLGWHVDGEPTYFINFPIEDATYRAVWAIGSSAIAYNPMGGTFASGENGIRQGNTGDSYVIPQDPTRSGHTFEGWYLTPECLVPAPDDGLIPPYSATYYAKWGLADITVDLYVDGVLYSSPTGKYQSVVEYETPSKEGATFVGWKLPGSDDATASLYPIYGAVDGVRYDAVFRDGVVTVVYNAQGGMFSDDDGFRSGTAGDTYAIPLAPAKEGYDFSGWYDAPVGGSKVHGEGDTEAVFPLGANTMIYAHYTARQITLTLDAGAEASPDIQNVAGEAYANVVYETPKRDGFSFLGWKSVGAADSSAMKNLLFPTKDATYYAVWAENSIKLMFDAMGGTIADGDERNGVPGDTFDIPSAAYPGYLFAGWYDRAVGGSLVYAPDAVSATYPSTSATYFARWVPLSITATLDAGTGAVPETQEAEGLFGQLIPYSLPVKAGHAFAGWKVDGEADATAMMLPTFLDEDGLTYRAVWLAGQSSIAYDPQGGAFAAGENGTRTGVPGTGYTPPADPILAGNVFGGWFTQPNGQGDPYTAKTIPTETNVTVYAQWIPRKAEITFDLNYEGAPAVEKVSGANGEPVIYDMPSREGHAFLGWSTTSDGSSVDTTYFPDFRAYAQTLYAQWMADQVTLRFHPVTGFYGAGEDGMRTGSVGGEYAIPSAPERPGYAFEGWFADIQEGNRVDPDGVFPSGSATYYAHWQADPIEVTLDHNYTGAPAPATAQGIFHEKIDYDVPQRAGYAFLGWDEDPLATRGDLHPTFPRSTGATYYAVWEAQTITVTYDAMEGDFALGSQSVHSGHPGDVYNVPAVMRDGYLFTGWYTTPLGTTLAPGGAIPEEDATYYAQWSRKSIEATFDLKGGSVNGSADDVVVQGFFNQIVKWPEPTREGSVFAGWKLQGDPDGEARLFLSFPAQNTTYEAVWVPADQVTVSYNGMGGELDGQGVFTGLPGASYTAPAMKARTGYVFDGWVAQAGAMAVDHQPGDAKAFPDGTSHAIYYAKWSANDYTVTLDFNDGGSPSVERTGAIGEMIEYASILPVREGYVFKGWGASASTTDYELFPRYSDLNDRATLYAQWDRAGLLVSFFEQEGAGADVVLSGKAGQTYQVPADPIRDGFAFEGWFSGKQGTGEKLAKAAGEEVVFESGMNVAWYASWSPVPITLTLDANGGIIEGQGSVECSGFAGDPVSYTAPQRQGYAFDGWNTGTAVTASPEFPAATDQTYYAEWKPIPVSLFYDATDGEFSGDDTGMFFGLVDETFTAPNDPSREGHAFAGWHADIECTVVAPDLERLPDANTTFYAKWVPNAVSVQLSAPSSNIELQTYNGVFGEAITYIAPMKAGHTFIGWKQRGTQATMMRPTYPASDAVYDAQFIEGSIVVTFDINGGSYIDAGSGIDAGLRAGEAGATRFVPDAETVAFEGHDFLGWFTKPEGGAKIGNPDGSFTIPNLPATYYAQWEAQMVQVSLDPLNGQGPVSATGRHGQKVEYDIPTKAGSTFMGWSPWPAGSVGDADMFPHFMAELQGTTLYAVWAAGIANVSFDAMEGSPHASFTCESGSSFIVPDNPVREGHDFEGWYDAPAGGAKQGFTAGESVVVTDMKNHAYYARYQAKSAITVTLYGGIDATPPQQDDIGAYGSAISYSEPTRPGFIFMGWKMRTDPVLPDGMAQKDIVFPANDADFDAVWKAENVTYSFDPNGGMLSDADTRSGATDDAFALPSAPTRTGYRFTGWYSLPLGGSLVYAATTTTATFGLSSATYFAHWMPLDGEVILDANEGGYADSSTSKTYEGSFDDAVDYEVPTRTGHAFVGWAEADDAVPDDAAVVVTIGLPGSKRYAVWSSHEASVLFRTEGGSFRDADEKGVREGSKNDPLGSVPLLDLRPGFTFGGWFTEPDGQGQAIAGSPVFVNVGTDVYYAYWIAEASTMTLDAQGGVFPTGNAVQKSFVGAPGAAIQYGEIPVRPGYGFMGWNGDPAATAGDMNPVFAPLDATYYAMWRAGATTLTFQPNGGVKSTGSSDLVITDDTGAQYAVPAVERKGYAFVRWWTSPVDASSGASVPGMPGETCIMPAMDAIYYAQWRAVDHSTTLDAQGGAFAGANPTTTVTGIQGQLIPGLPGYELPAYPGHTFIGWSDVPDGGSADAENYPHVDADTATLYAVWQVDTVTVAYNATEGAGGGVVRADAGSTYTEIPGGAPVRAGYDFAGWFADPIDGASRPHPSPVGGEYLVPNEDMTWFAQWNAATVTVTLDAGDGSFEDGASTKDCTGTYAKAIVYEQPSRPGYLFSGWNTGSATMYSVTYPSVDGLTYQAQWAPLTYTKVSYEVQGGTVDAGSTSFNGLPTTAYSAADVATVSREGYAFAGWFSMPDGQGSAHPAPDGQGAYAFPAYDAVWYAAWNAEPIEITLDPAGGTIDGSTAPKDTEGVIGTAIDYSIPQRAGYAFLGWNADTAARQGDMFPLYQTSLAGKTLFAIWEADAVSATFFTLGGSFEDSVDAHFVGSVGTSFTVPENPVRIGYEFKGWFEDPGYNAPSTVTAGDIVQYSSSKANMSYWAKWDRIEIEVTLKGNAGSVEGQESVVRTGYYGDAVPIGLPVLPGFTFAGWSTDAAAQSGKVSILFPEADETYHATWIPHTIKARFEGMLGEVVGSEEQEGAPGTPYTVPTATREGYAFKGWGTKPNMAVPDGPEKETTQQLPSSSVVYYAQWEQNVTTITLDLNGGNIDGDLDDVTKAGYVDERVLYQTPRLHNHIFLGWRASGESDQDAKMYLVFPAADDVYYAVWKRADLLNAYYYALDGALIGEPAYDDQRSDRYTAPSAAAPDGYAFAGWTAHPEEGTIHHRAGDIRTFGPQPMLYYYAVYTPRADITVTLDPNGGNLEGSMSEKAMTNLCVGDELNYSTPVREGYLFIGWGEARQSERSDMTPFVPSADTTLYAQWKEGDKGQSAYVTYQGNGGEVAGDALYAGMAGETYIAPAVRPREGHTFAGWAPTYDATSAEHQAGDVRAFTPVPQTDYFALWKVRTDITIRLNVNGGTWDGASTEDQILINQTFGRSIATTLPERAGHLFMGWSTDASAALGNPNIQVPGTDTTYYATWMDFSTPLEDSFAFYDGAGGTVLGMWKVEGLAGAVYEAPDAHRDGYAFLGWSQTPDGAVHHSAHTNASLPDSGWVRYWALWTPRTDITITLDPAGGTLIGSSVLAGQAFGSVIQPETPKREGYLFAGWQPVDLSKTPSSIITIGTEDLTYQATWIEMPVDPDNALVLYDGVGGEVTPSEPLSGQRGSAYTAPTATREGYRLSGWAASPTGPIDHAPSAGCIFPDQSAAVYYALWEPRADITITAKPNNASDPSKLYQNLVAGDILYPTVPTYAGFLFLGWVEEGSGDQPSTAIVVPGSDADYEAVWQKEYAPSDMRMALFDAQGGSLAQGASPIVAGGVGSTYLLPAVEERPGFTFDGWLYGTTLYQPGDEFAYDDTVQKVFIASWTMAAVDVTLDAPGSDIESQAFIGHYGDAVPYETPYIAGRVFKGWKAVGSEGSTAQRDLAFPLEGGAFEAVWEIAGDLNVIYELCGGESPDGSTDPIVKTGKRGMGYSLPSGMFRDGHRFAGWFEMPDAQGKPHPLPDNDGRVFFPDEEAIWYAAWEAVAIGNILDANGGTISGSGTVSVSGTVGQPIIYDLPERPGYSFIGWAPAQHAVQGDLSPVFETAHRDKPLYALWRAGVSSVAFMAQGGDADTLVSGAVETEYAVPENPVRPGYRFLGWFDQPNGGNKQAIEAGDRLVFENTANTAFWAQWERKAVTVTLDGAGGLIDGAIRTGAYGDPIAYSPPMREGYSFRGWATDAQASAGTMSLAFPDEDSTFYAVWAPETVVVTFDAAGGSLDGQAEYRGVFGGSYDPPGDPVRAGYAFRGWSTKVAGSADQTIGSFPARNIVYFALWDSTAASIIPVNRLQDGDGSDGSLEDGDRGREGAEGEGQDDRLKPRIANRGLLDGYRLVVNLVGGDIRIDEASDNRDHTYLFIPDQGYRIASVTIDGKEVETDGNGYLFADVQGVHSVDAKFIVDGATPLAAFELAARSNPLLWLIPIAALLLLGGSAAYGATSIIRKRGKAPEGPGTGVAR